MVEAAEAMNVSKSAMDEWLRQIEQEIQGAVPLAIEPRRTESL
ncbi:hypothetical protein [Vibrio sp. T11.5]